MKKAEAISILATSVRPREAKDRARYDEAVKMAIEALKSSEQTVESAQNVQDEDLISKLSEIRSDYNCFNAGEEPQYRALSEAIKILSQRADGDTISRQAVIEALQKEIDKGIPPFDDVIGSIRCGVRLARNIVEDLPSAAPSTAHTTETTAETTAPSTDDWIPVERELPEDLAEVNVTWVNHEPEPYYESIKSKPFTASAVYYEGNWYWYSSVCADVLAEYGRNDVDKVDDTIEITAWKPLPEPYRGGEKE